MVICLEPGADCLHMVQLMPVHPKTPSSLASFKSRLVLRLLLTQIVLEKRPLNECSSSSLFPDVRRADGFIETASGQIWFSCKKTKVMKRLTVMWYWHSQPVPAAVVWCSKGKGSPYLITERRVPELIPVLGSQPVGDVSHKPGSRLPLLSTRPAVTLATLKRAATKFAAW